MHVESLRGGPAAHAPHVAHQLLTGEYLAGAEHEGEQQVEFLRRQAEFVVAQPRAPRFRVDAHAVDVGHLRRTAAQQCPHPGQQLGEPERLGHVVVSTCVEADNEVDLLGTGGQNQDRYRAAFSAHTSTYLEAVHRGQPEIENHEVDAAAENTLQHRSALALDLDLVPLTTQGT